MAKYASPMLRLGIGEEQWQDAVRASSGGCLIADAIKKQYPQFSRVVVDMATIRMSDKAKGVRYTYLTPAIAQHLLLSFDQGWSQPVDELIVKKAVKVDPIVTDARRTKTREERLAELEAREADGTITASEKGALTTMRRHTKRPAKRGPAEAGAARGVVHGGTPIAMGPAHPNLLRGRDRVYGAKHAQPAEAFQEALEAAKKDWVREHGLETVEAAGYVIEE